MGGKAGGSSITTAQPTFDPTAASGAPTYRYEEQGEGSTYRTSAKGKAGGSSITTAQLTFDPAAASGAPTYRYEEQGEGGTYRTSAKGKAGGSSITTAHFRQSQQSAQTRVTMHERVARAPQPVAQPQAPAAVEEDSYEATA